MNASDILKYGNLTVLNTVKGVPESEWETAGVCGWWSVKNIIAHLTSFEYTLTEVLNTFLGSEAGPHMLSWGQDGQKFNDVQVAKRDTMSPGEVLAEYERVQARTMELLAQISVGIRREVGTISWYGPEYALDDLIVYAFYGHKREHCSQIAVFIDQNDL